MYVSGTQGGGIRIKDATATPDDVATGMIFYNNDGRQVGAGRMVKQILLPQNLEWHNDTLDAYRGLAYYSYDGYTFSYDEAEAGSFGRAYYVKVSGVYHIVGVEIDGHYSFCPSGTGYTAYCIDGSETETGYAQDWFYHYRDSVYLTYGSDIPSSFRKRQIIIHYTDE